MNRLALVLTLVLCSGCINVNSSIPEPLPKPERELVEAYRQPIARGFQFRYDYIHDDHVHDALEATNLDLIIQRRLKPTALIGRSAPYGSVLQARVINTESSSTVLNVFSALTLFVIPGYVGNEIELELSLLVEDRVVAKTRAKSSFWALAQILLLPALVVYDFGLEEVHVQRLLDQVLAKFLRELEKKGEIPDSGLQRERPRERSS